MKKIAIIQDLSSLGKCSLTAAIPVISVMGLQPCPLPTAVLSNQTGFPSFYLDDYTDRMERIMEEWKKRNFIPDGIYTGFLAGERQADIILKFLEEFARDHTWILIDPVMGDKGSAFGFYTDALCEKMRVLAEKAHVITPNLTEAILLLKGKDSLEETWDHLSKAEEREYLSQIESLGKALCQRFSLRAAVITGIDLKKEGEPSRIGNLVWEQEKPFWIFSQKYGGSYSGTGDMFASVLCGGLVKGMSMEASVKKAVSFLSGAIRDTVREGTDRNEGIAFEPHLWELV
ncbi:MAG TPA: pyridoxamine kinase [Candidatus Blautia faecavium]|uniref:pyridoxal kinase n=1 Tax=Candidatus Blautia faecavium TaxID=2838487 RepID=A0A9D2RYE7_9FIRM|nr:pyridoxamine kinase [Candidatus Blautia faecavium]